MNAPTRPDPSNVPPPPVKDTTFRGESEGPAPKRQGLSMGREFLALGLPMLILGGMIALFAWNPSGSPAGGEPSSGSAQVAWERDVEAGIRRASTAGQPALLFFTADWCGPCQMLKRTTLTQEPVAERIEADFVPILVDMTTPQQYGAIAEHYEIQFFPTLLPVDANGQPAGPPLIGVTEGAELIAALEKAKQTADARTPPPVSPAPGPAPSAEAAG